MKVMKTTVTLLILFVLFALEGFAQEDASIRPCDSSNWYTSYDLTTPTKGVGCVAYDPSGNYLASGGTDEKIYIWCAKDGNLFDVLEGHEGDINSLAFSRPDGKWIASGSDDGTVRLWKWNGATWQAVEDETKSFDRTFFGLVLNPLDNNVDGVAFGFDDTTNPKSMLLACGTRGGKVVVWRSQDSEAWKRELEIEVHRSYLNINSKRVWMPLQGDVNSVISVAFSPDGTLIAFGGDDNKPNTIEKDNSILLVNIKSGQISRQLTEHHEAVNSIAFSRDGNFLASGGEDDRINLWRRSNGYFIHDRSIEGHHSDVKSVAFTPDGTVLVSASKDGTLGVWNISSEDPQADLADDYRLFMDRMGWSVVNSIAFVPQDGLTVMACGSQDGKVRQRALTETVDIKARFDLLPRQDLISDVAFAEKATYFVLNPWFPNVSDAEYTNFLREKLIEDLGVNVPNITGADILQDKCTITLDIDGVEETLEDADSLENPLYFMYELKTPQERLIELEQEIQGKRVEGVVTAGASTLIGWVSGFLVTKAAGPKAGGLTGAAAGFATKLVLNEIILSGKRNRVKTEILAATVDPVFIIDGFTRDFDWQIPRYLFMIQKPLTEIKIKINQTFRFNILSPSPADLYPAYTVSSEGTWNLKNHTWTTSEGRTLKLIDNTWVPGAPAMSLSNYPPFQELPADVQAYLLKYFGEFSNAETWQIPEETSLLPNYPNPFNPETWLPYQLSEPAAVTVTIYDIQGRVVRALDLGHQRAGIYHSRSRAAHWDGRNAVGEPVASGLYFYTLEADDFTATRKMLIRK